MKSFKQYRIEIINEAIRASDAGKVSKLIGRYLQKKLGQVYLYPSVERFSHPKLGVIDTITYITPRGLEIRFNWSKNSIDTGHLSSVSVVLPNGEKYLMKFDREVSLVQSLPTIVDTIKNNKLGKFDVYLDEDHAWEQITGQMISETTQNVSPLEWLQRHFATLSAGDDFRPYSLGKRGGHMVYRLAQELVRANPSALNGKTVQSTDVDWTSTIKMFNGSKVAARYQKDTSKEKWIAPAGVDEKQAEEQITYIEKIQDLSNMIKFMLKGATNAVFVAGRGGTGKTQTVEDTLEEEGLQDGSGYFKVTGSASPAAVYEALYRNRTGVILFDDADGALDTQDGRNLIKAATDTKAIRKVAWLKKSRQYYDPGVDGPDAGDEDEFDDRLPRYFEFTGKVIFISNLPMKKLDPDGALKTRGLMIEMNPSNVDMYDYMKVIYDKVRISGGNELSLEKRKEVVHALRDIIENSPPHTVNLRLLVRALNLAATGLPDWKRMLRYA